MMYTTDILSKIMKCNMEHQQSLAECKKWMHPYSFAKDHQTIKLGYGRRTGKTTAIKELSGFGDIVFAHSLMWQKELTRYLNAYFRDITVLTYDDIEHRRFKLGKKTGFRVWIDEQSLFKDRQIHAIYNVMAEGAVQFILLG